MLNWFLGLTTAVIWIGSVVMYFRHDLKHMWLRRQARVAAAREAARKV